MKKIVFVSPGELPTPALKGGAVETLITMLVEENEIRHKYDMEILTVSDDKLHFKNYKNTKIILINIPSLIKWIDRVIHFYWENIKKNWRAIFYRNYLIKKYYSKKISSYLRENCFDMVIVENNMSLLENIFFTLGEEQFSQKCIYHMHSVLVDKPSMIKYMKRCCYIIAVSNYIIKAVKGNYPELSHTDFKMLLNAADIKIKKCPAGSDMDKYEVRNFYDIAKNDFVYLYSGRISAEKGVKELVRAFEMLDVDNTKLVIAGGSYSGEKAVSQYEHELRLYCEKNKLNVAFLGFIPNTNMSKIYRMSDVLVIPSVVEEAASVTGIEGMIMEIPIIATRIGALPEYLKDYAIYAEPGAHFVYNLCKKMEEIRMKFTKPSLQGITLEYFSRIQYFERFVDIVD